MPSSPRAKRMQSIINSIIGKPENRIEVKRSSKEVDLWRRLNYDLTRMIR